MKLNKWMMVPVFGLLAATAFAQAASGQAGVPKLIIDSPAHDFGTVEAGNPLSYTFKLKNTGTADLLIKNVAPS